MFQGFHTMLGKLRKGQIQLRQTTQVKRRQLKLHEKTHLTLHEIKCIKYKNWLWDLPGGKVVENLPCEVEDVCSIPDQGTKIPHATGQLSPCATSTEPVQSGAWPPRPRKLVCHQEKLPRYVTNIQCTATET